MKIRRIAILICLVVGAGYKYGPAWMHPKLGADRSPTASQTADAKSVTNRPTIRPTTPSQPKHAVVVEKPDLANGDLGVVALTNRTETCVPLGNGRDCLITPNLVGSRQIQLTLTVESKQADGRMRDFMMTQVMASQGKPVEVALGDVTFNLTPQVSGP